MLEPYPFLACYEVSDDLDANMKHLLAGRATRRASGPAWVAQNRYASWNAEPAGPASDIELFEHMLLVVVAAPVSAPQQEYDDWYRAWFEEAAADPRVVTARRFRMSPSPVDEGLNVVPPPTHLALLDIQGDEGSRHPEKLASFAPLLPIPWRDEAAVDVVFAAALTSRVTAAN